MNLPIDANVIDRVSGGSRNHIVLGSFFMGGCEQIKVEFLVIENSDKEQAVWRVDSEPKAFEEMVSSFRNVQYLIEQPKDQFIREIFPDKSMGLFDCRSGTDVLKDYQKVEIVRSLLQEDNSFRRDYYEWKPCQVRMVLCKVSKNEKSGLIAVLCVDAMNYGFERTDFGTEVQIKFIMEVIYDSITIDTEKMQIVAEKDGEKTIIPLS